jgi:hypothetical protein
MATLFLHYICDKKESYRLLYYYVMSVVISCKKNMYAVSKSCIKVNNELTDYFPTLLGVKQGDNLSPNLFKIIINNLTVLFENQQSRHIIFLLHYYNIYL